MNVAEQLRAGRSAAAGCVRCLGQFRLHDGAGHELHVRTRKARALLAFLAISGRPCSRERLADLLWSDRGEEQAKASVRQALFELRHVGQSEGLLVTAGRDEAAVDPHLLTTDLCLIRVAAEANDYHQLQELLQAIDTGLLTDLDGLDPEFDNWLRIQRTSLPSRTLAVALAAAERCLRDEGPRAAHDIVSEIQRLDPDCEEAVRLVLRVDHQLGDSSALHRHYAQFCDRLGEEYAAAPSQETQELFAKLAGSRAADGRSTPAPEELREAGEDSGAAASDDWRGPAAPPRVRLRRWQFGAAALLALAAAAILGLTYWVSRAPAASSEPVLIAVLPFEQQPAGDGFLAEGLWDDTRAALSRNGNLRVLGRTTTEVMATANLAPDAYLERLGVAYLLEGSLRNTGEQVRVSVSLTRTADGVGIWNASFAGRLGDPLALQEAIARGIEGRLRGRLARSGGRRPEQIATSAEVYGLYSEARTLLRERGAGEARRAEQLLRRAVALDPNFAPASASLGAALYFSDRGPVDDEEKRAESLAHVERALMLAPNLAQAHATLALIAGDASDSSERALEKAVALDPDNAEAWNWLGNLRNQQYRRRDALEAYRRAVEIDPLWFPAVHNFASISAELGDRTALDKLIAKIRRAGADRELIVTTEAENAITRGDYSSAVAPLLALVRQRPGQPQNPVLWGACDGLIRLGYADEAGKLGSYPGWYGPVIRGERLPPDSLHGAVLTPDEFWRTQFFSAFASRALVSRGHGARLVDKYRAAFADADEFISELGDGETLELLSPTLSVALRRSGSAAEADYLLDAAAKRLERVAGKSPANRDLLWRLGTIRAAQGRREDALRLLGGAVSRGWLPDGRFHALDLAQEPAFHSLKSDPRFRALRARILAHIARERAELGPITV